MNKFTPFLRYINLTDFMPNNEYTVAYDCRMLYVIEGYGILHTEYGDYELKENTFAYYPSGVKYFPQSLSDEKMRFITVNFDFNDIHENITETLIPVSIDKFSVVKEFPSYYSIDDEQFSKPFIIKNAMFLKNNLMKMYENFYSGSQYSKDISSAILKLCILDILSYRTNKISNPLVEEIKDYVLANFNTIDSNAKIAQKFQYHEYYLNNLFKKYTGSTIHKFIIDTRIKNAEELLTSSSLSISEIAANCGFINSDHFSRLFKQRNGMSPLQYRNISRYI